MKREMKSLYLRARWQRLETVHLTKSGTLKSDQLTDALGNKRKIDAEIWKTKMKKLLVKGA